MSNVPFGRTGVTTPAPLAAALVDGGLNRQALLQARLAAPLVVVIRPCAGCGALSPFRRQHGKPVATNVTS